MDPLSSFLVKLAPSSAEGWIALGAEVFRGGAELETTNSVYLFHDGVLTGRARKPARSTETPSALVGLRLVGFLSEEDGLYALSPRWRPDALGVFFRAKRAGAPDPRSFVVTTQTVAFTVEPPPSGARLRKAMHPPAFVRPVPASLTRLFAASLP